MRVVTALNYFTPSEIESLSRATGVTKSSTSVKRQSQLLGFLQALSSRIGFPQRTIATAQLLYLRFHLFFNPSDFIPHEVGIACLVVAAKINDTPKKSREVILNSWALRYPELVRAAPVVKQGNVSFSSAAAGSSKNPVAAPQSSPLSSSSSSSSSAFRSGLGIISESDVDANVLDKERKRILALESLLLQSIAFDFNVQINDSLNLTAKLAKKLAADKEFSMLAWQVAADCHRTYAPLSYPPSTIAAASVYAASLLSMRCSSPSPAAPRIIAEFDKAEESLESQDWQRILDISINAVEDVVHALLDLYGSAVASLPSSTSSSTGITPISPATPASPSDSNIDNLIGDNGNPLAGRKLPSHVYSPPPFGVLYWCNHGITNSTSEMLNELTQIKIALRRNEEQRDTKEYTAKASKVRIFDKGGIKGDEEKIYEAEVEEKWQERAKDKQYSALQRFLF